MPKAFCSHDPTRHLTSRSNQGMDLLMSLYRIGCLIVENKENVVFKKDI